MADTPRSKSALQALLADNVTGDISAQDTRDFLVSTIGYDFTREITTATYSLVEDDIILHVTRTTTGACEITIPTALITDGRYFIVKDGGYNATVNNITVKTQGSELINGSSADYVMSTNGTRAAFYCRDGDVHIKSNGAVQAVAFTWSTADVANSDVNVFGTIYSSEQTGVTLDSVTPQSITNMYNRHYIVNVTTMTSSGTITLTGNAVNEYTGVITPASTEDIVVSATGYYQSSTKWIGQVTASTADADLVIDTYSTTYVDAANSDFQLFYTRMGFKPSSGTWDIKLELKKVNNDGSLTDIAGTDFEADNSDTYLRAASGVAGNIKRIWTGTDIPQFAGTSNEGIIVEVTGKVGTPTNITEADVTIVGLVF